MTIKRLLLALSLASLPLVPSSSAARDAASIPRDLLKPLADSWPTYSGDYTGRRYSALTQVNRLTVKNLTLAWTSA